MVMIGMSSSKASTTIMIALKGWMSKITLDITTTSMIAIVMAMR